MNEVQPPEGAILSSTNYQLRAIDEKLADIKELLWVLCKCAGATDQEIERLIEKKRRVDAQ